MAKGRFWQMVIIIINYLFLLLLLTANAGGGAVVVAAPTTTAAGSGGAGVDWPDLIIQSDNIHSLGFLCLFFLGFILTLKFPPPKPLTQSLPPPHPPLPPSVFELSGPIDPLQAPLKWRRDIIMLIKLYKILANVDRRINIPVHEFAW